MSAPMAEPLLLRIEHSPWKCELRLNRPDKANALSPGLVSGLAAALSAAYADETRLLILSGNGKNFCAGFDRSEEVSLGREGIIERTLQIELALQLLWHAPFVTVACVQGAAMGAGADLVAACDYRLAGPNTRFAFPGFRAFGVSLGTRRLAELIGGHRAFDLVLNARRLDGEEALAAGLLTHLLEPDRMLETIGGIETEVAAVGKASIAVLREATRATQSSSTSDLERVARSIMHAKGR